LTLFSTGDRLAEVLPAEAGDAQTQWIHGMRLPA
jgi:hypothetical protein